MKRRTVLATAASITTASIAGCSDDIAQEDEHKPTDNYDDTESSDSVDDEDSNNGADDSPESDDSHIKEGAKEDSSGSDNGDTRDRDEEPYDTSTDTDEDPDTSNGSDDGEIQDGDDDANEHNGTDEPDDSNRDESDNGDDEQESEPEYENQIINTTPIGVTDLSVSGCTLSATVHRGETNAASVRIVFQVIAYDGEEEIDRWVNNIEHIDEGEDSRKLSHELDDCESATHFVLEIDRIDEIEERESDVDGHLSMEGSTDRVINIVSHEFVTEDDGCYIEAVAENKWDEEIEALIFVEVHWRGGRYEETTESVGIAPEETETVQIDTGNCLTVESYIMRAALSGQN